MIVDLDAHQGDGHERDFQGDDRVYIVDAYTPGIFPNARDVMSSIRASIRFRGDDTGARFLGELKRVLPASMAEFAADVVVYNAGTRRSALHCDVVRRGVACCLCTHSPRPARPPRLPPTAHRTITRTSALSVKLSRRGTAMQPRGRGRPRLECGCGGTVRHGDEGPRPALSQRPHRARHVQARPRVHGDGVAHGRA